MKEPGKLILVGTPIGNLEDMSPRAIRTLQEADLVAAEDTRHSRKLFTHFGIHTQLISYHMHNEAARGQWLVEKILEGYTVALISDAGMPGISDPGEEVVAMAAAAGIAVTVIPGPSAGISALAVSGLPTGRFVFEGFLPKTGKDRSRRLEELKTEPRTSIFYVAPHQLEKDLKALFEALGDRRAVLVRELSKLYEEAVRDSLAGLLEKYSGNGPRGEMVLVVEGRLPERETPSPEVALKDMHTLVSGGMKVKDSARQTSEKYGVPVRDLYNRYIKEYD